jgi:tetratricopeptide (TPR) repeat protein
MKKVWIIGFWLVAGAGDAAPPGAAAGGMVPATDEDTVTLWYSPSFQRAFMGTYGVNAEIEPRTTAPEKEQMEKVLALMKEKNGAEKARVHLERAITRDMSAVFDFTLGNIYFQRDMAHAAAKWYQRAIEKFPSFQRAHKNLGLALARAKDYEKAIEPLSRAIELGANDAVTYGLLAFAYLMTEQFSAAEGAYRQAVMLQPASVDWKLGLTRCLFRQGKFDETVTLCDELIRRDPGRSDYWLLQANAFLGLKQPIKAALNYEHLNFLGQGNTSLLNSLGDIYVNEGMFDVAADTYLEAFDRDPASEIKRMLRNIEVLASRGAVEDASGIMARLRDASGGSLSTEDRKRLLKVEARLASARGAAGGESAAILEEIVKLDPTDGEALILLGQQYAATGDVEKAVFMFERAAGMSQYEADAILRHAQTLVRAGKYQQAVPLLKRTLELRPRDEVARYLEQVERAARARN